MTGADRQAGAEAELARLERAVTRLETALASVGRGLPVPRAVLALFCAPTPPLDAASLAPHQRIRLVATLARLETLSEDISSRQRLVATRLAAVRAAQRPAHPEALRVDQRG